MPKNMKSTLFINESTFTAYVRLNIQSCTACWECLVTCPGKVIDKSFLYISGSLILKHALMYDADECLGCLKCISACKLNAISIIK